MEQSIQTDTQAARIEREQEEASARDKARQKKEAARKKAARADNWLLSKISELSDGQAKGLAAANVALVVGLGAVLGYKAWGLHERGQFSWRTAGVGAGIVGVVGVVEGVFGQYVFLCFRLSFLFIPFLIFTFALCDCCTDLTSSCRYFTKARGSKRS